MEKNNSNDDSEAPESIKHINWFLKNWKKNIPAIIILIIIAILYGFYKLDSSLLNEKYKNKIKSFASSYGSCDIGYNNIAGRLVNKTKKSVKPLNITNLRLTFKGTSNPRCTETIKPKHVIGEVFTVNTKKCSPNEKVRFFIDNEDSIYKLGSVYESTICSDTIDINIYDK